MKLDRYFGRVGFHGDARPTISTLASLLRCHVCSVPFENIDVQLRRSLTTDTDEAFEKIVDRRRGGWCYEQNGLFGWALSEIGFDVTRVAAAVRRDERGDSALHNHLSLLVRAPDAMQSVYLADVGFGGSMITPIEFTESEHIQVPYRIGLRLLDDGHWRFIEEAAGGGSYYDFIAKPADESAMSAKCEELQNDPQSLFVLNLVVQRRWPDKHVQLRGRVLTTTSANGEQSRLLETADELAHTVSSLFGLDVLDVAQLWPVIVARNGQLFES